MITALSGFAAITSAQTQVFCNGDSITFGIDASDIAARSYAPVLGTLLGEAYRVERDGTGGATLLKKGQPSFWETGGITNTRAASPRIVTVLLGTNDSKRDNWANRDEFVGDYISLIDTFRSLPSAPDILVGIPPPAIASPNDVNGPTIANEVIPRILEAARRRGVKVVDLHSPFLDTFQDLFPDSVHPGDEGHRQIAGHFRDAILHGSSWTALPPRWQRVDLGTTGLLGGDAVDQDDVHHILGAGAAIGGVADACRFISQHASGDIELTARYLGQRNLDPLAPERLDAFAGISIRESEAPTARKVALLVTPGRGLSLNWRAIGDMPGESLVALTELTMPVWLRLTRSGEVVTAYYSVDGVAWMEIASPLPLTLGGEAQIGLLAGAGEGAPLLTHARFDEVRLMGESLPPLGSAYATLDPDLPTGRAIEEGAVTALFDADAPNHRFVAEGSLSPLLATFPGSLRRALAFDGTRALTGPPSNDVFHPDSNMDAGLVFTVSTPTNPTSGTAVFFSVGDSSPEPALALGFDYTQSRFFVSYLSATEGAPTAIFSSPVARGRHVITLQKSGATVRLRVNGVVAAEALNVRVPLLLAPESATLALGGPRADSPQFSGHLGKLTLYRGELSDRDAVRLEVELRAWMEAGTFLAAPKGLTAASLSLGASLQWTSVEGATGYRLYRADQVSGPFQVVATGLTSSSYDDTGLSSNTLYYYTVAAINGELEGSRSPVVTVVAYAPVQAWRVENGLPFDGSGEGADTLDLNGLGVPNLLRYALGMSARSTDLAELPTLEVEENGLAFRFSRGSGRSDIDLFVEGSPNLAPESWVVLAHSIRGGPLGSLTSGTTVVETDADDGSGEKLVKVLRDTSALGYERYFMRLRVRR